MSGNSKVKVFIAEDDPIIQAGFIMMLEMLGYEIAGQASDGETAVDMILKCKPDLILMDINMPKLDGLSAVEKIRQRTDIPAIIITGYRDNKQIERAAGVGVYGYLHKPVDEYELKAEIEVVLNRHKKVEKLEKDLKQAITSLEERKIIERAKGIVMKQKSLPEAEAFRFMQKKSRDTNVKLIDLAKKIIKSDELFR